MLPDIDTQTYTDAEQEEFKRRAERQQGAFGFLQGAQEHVAQLQGIVGTAAANAGEAIGGAASAAGQAIGQTAEAAGQAVGQTAQVGADQMAQLQAAISGGVSSAQPPAAAAPTMAPPTEASAPPPPPDAMAQLQAAISAGTQGIGAGFEQAQQFGADQMTQLQRAVSQGFAGAQRSSPPAGGMDLASATPDDIRSYITQAAQSRGIDPTVALKVAQSEGGLEPARRGTFKSGSSWWPFQLHYGGPGYEQYGDTAGMGSDFTAKTGYQPGDPNAWQASVDYALDRAKQSGWGAWYGAAAQGITGMTGINKETPVLGGVGEAAGRAFRDISQFGDPQLSASEAEAACGPAAAVRFAQRFGRNPTLREATDLAASVGWTPGQGMAGIASEQQLLNKLGVETTLVQGPQWDRFAQEAQTGNPVTISTGAHYFYADGYDPGSGAFHVGRSGTDLRGGKEWMTADEIQAAAARLGGGGVQGALLANNPTVPASSTAEPTTGAGNLFTQALSGAKSAAAQGLETLMRSSEEAQARGRAYLDEQTRNLDQAVTGAVQERQRDWGGIAQNVAGLNERIMATPAGQPAETMLQGVQGRLGEVIPKTYEDFTARIQSPEREILPGTSALSTGLSALGAGTKLGMDVINEVAPPTAAARVHAGEDYMLWQDPVASQLLRQAGVTPESSGGDRAMAILNMTPAEQMLLRERTLQARSQGPAAASAAAWEPGSRREELETAYNLAAGATSALLAPQGLASGVGRFAASVALDPTNLATEVPALVGRVPRALEAAAEAAEPLLTARQPARAAFPKLLQSAPDIIEEAGQEVPVARLPQLENNITGAVADAVGQAIGRDLTPEEIADAQRTLAGAATTYGKAALNPFQAIATPEGLARARNQLRALANQGAEQRFWYDDSSRKILEATQGNRQDAEKIAQLVAIYSNNTPVSENLNNAITAWTQWKNGMPIDAPTLGGNNARARQLLEQGVDWEGAKTNNFYRNLMKNIDQEKYLQMGRETGQTGATIDVWMMRALNSLVKSPSKNSGQYEFAADEVGRIAKEFGWTPEQAQAAIWVATKAGWENAKRRVPMDLSAEGIFHYGTALEERLGRMAGAAGSDIARVTQDATGVDTVARDLGLLGADGRIFLPKARGTRAGEVLAEDIGMVDQAAREAMNVYTAGIAKQLQLPEAYWAREFDPRKLDEANGVVVNIGRQLTPEEAMQLQDNLDGLTDVGVTKVLPTDNGAWIINRSDAPNKAFHKASERALDGVESIDAATAAPRRFDAEFFSNDWSKQPNGEGYLASIQQSGGRAAERWQEIESRLAGQVSDVGRGGGRTAADLAAGAADLAARAEGPARQLGRASTEAATTLGGAAAGGATGWETSEGQPLPARLLRTGLGAAAGAGLGYGGARILGRGAPAVREAARVAEEVAPAAAEEIAPTAAEAARIERMVRSRAESAAREFGMSEEELRRRVTADVLGRRPSARIPEEPEIITGEPRTRGPEPERPPPSAAEEPLEWSARSTEPTAEARQFAGNLGLGKYVPEEVRDIIATVYDATPDAMEAARRGVVPDQAVREMADDLGISTDTLVKRWKPGNAANAETILALRQSLANEGQRVLSAQRSLRRNRDSTDAQLRLTEALTRMQAVQEVVHGVTAEAGRSVRQFRQGVEGRSVMLERLTKAAKAKGMTTEELVTHLADVDLESPKEALKLARDLNPATKWDKAWALWYFSLLSTPTTHLRNITSNAITTGMTPVESGAAALLDPAARAALRIIGGKTTGRERFAGEALQDIRGIGKAFGKAPLLGENEADAVGLAAGLPAGIRRALRAYADPATAEDILGGHAQAEAFTGALGHVIHAPGRALRAEDAFFKTLNESAAAQRLAFRDAKRAGLKSNEDIAAWMAERLRNPDEEFLKQVIDQGKYRTFQRESGFASDLARLRERNPALRFLLPFVRTPWNIGKYAAERSPLGFAGIVKDFATKGGRESLRSKGTGDLADRLGRASIGSLITAGLAGWGGENLTGRAPGDPTEADAFYRQGKQPYSFKNPLTGEWTSYQPLQPYAPLFAAVANANDVLKRHPEQAGNMPGLAGMMALSFGQGLLDMPWTQGLSDALDVMGTGGPGYEDIAQKAGRYGERQAASAVPGIVRALARAHDSTIRDPSGPLEAMMANVPFLEDRVAPRLSAFGQPRRRPVEGAEALFNIFQPSEATRDPVELALAELQKRDYDVEPGFVGKKVQIADLPVELTDEQRRQYQQASGQSAYAMLSLLIGTPEYEQLPNDQKAKLVDSIVNETRTMHREMMTPQLMPQAFESFQRQQKLRAGER